MFKRQLFCKSKKYLTKLLFRYLKNVSDSLLRPRTRKPLRYLKDICFANLTKALFRQLIQTSASCLGSIFRNNISFSFTKISSTLQAKIYLLKVNNRNTWKWCEICSKLTIKTSIHVISISVKFMEHF